MRRSWLFVPTTILSLGLLAISCGIFGGKDDNKGSSGPGYSTGCIQGALLDGLTSQPLSLTTLKPVEPTGIHVVARNQILRAEESGLQLADTKSNFLICNIPTDEELPLVVDVQGYQPVQGLVKISSTTASQTANANEDVERKHPTAVYNVTIYPIGVNTQDFSFKVTHRGEYQKGAIIDLLPTGDNSLNMTRDTHDLSMTSVPHAGLQATTDESGEAVFDHSQLVLGGVYSYRVIPADGGKERGLATGNIVVGFQSSGANNLPYQHFVDLANPIPSLAIVSQSFSTLDDNNASPSGLATLVFNREFEIVPGTEDQIIATLTDSQQAQLEPNNAINQTSDQVTVKVDGLKLMLSPRFATPPRKDRELGIKVTFSGIVLRPKQEPGTATWMQVPDITVNLYGGVNIEQILTTLRKPVSSGDNQDGPAGRELPTPLAVELLDQFGQPLATAQDVKIQVVSGGGSVRAANGTPQPVLNTTSDPETGLVEFYWTLGTTIGNQKVEVSSPGISAVVTFNANGRASVNYVSAFSGAGNFTTAGPFPLVAQVLDQNRQPFTTPSNVTFTITSGTGGLLNQAGSGTPVQTLTVQSDSTGKATVNLKPTAAGSFRVSALAQGVTTGVDFAVGVTSAPAILELVSGGNQSAAISTDLPQAVTFALKDQFSALYTYTNAYLRFTIVDGGGTVRTIGSTSAGSTTVTQYTNTLNAQAGITWKLGATTGPQHMSVTVDGNAAVPAVTVTATANP